MRSARIDYPRELLEIQVLDDSTDETRELPSWPCAATPRSGFDIKYIHRATAPATRPARSKPA